MITPIDSPNPENQMEWVFPDTQEGIQQALDKAANVFLKALQKPTEAEQLLAKYYN